MTDNKKLHQILSLLWKNDDSVGKTYYNQALQDIQTAIDLQEEPVSEDLDLGCGVIWKGEKPVSDDLEKAAEQDVCEVVNCCSATGIPNDHIPSWAQDAMINEFIHGAKWQKEHFWKPADGDDLPEIDREVIAIIDYDFGHYKVVYAHRPNPNGWNGTNIDTEEKEYFEPVIYDKGGWNQPHVLYWLDAKLPYEENKIEKEIEL